MVGVFFVLYFFLLFNKWDERVIDVISFCYLFYREGSLFIVFYCFSLVIILYYLLDEMFLFKEEVRFGF